MFGAHREGLLSDKNFQDNLAVTFLAGHENPQLALMSLMCLLGTHRDVQERLRAELNTRFPENAHKDFEPPYTDIHNLPLLTAVIYETLRLFPPLSQICNRRTSAATVLGGTIAVPAGVYLGYHGYSTNRDTEFWGADADAFKPERWGENIEDITQLHRRATAKGAFISFHGGRRACLGQKFTMEQLRITMVELLRGVRWSVDESWDGRMTPVSWTLLHFARVACFFARSLCCGFSHLLIVTSLLICMIAWLTCMLQAGPLYPRNLKLVFEELDDASPSAAAVDEDM